jgi:aerobic carbon-monoxide dehydrogenase large subunit
VTQHRKLIGARVKSVSAPRVLLGRTAYVDDIKIPNMLYLSFARSSTPHATLKSVNVQTALDEGTVAALTGENIRGEIEPFPIFAAPKGLRPIKKYPIATDKVRYVGEIVAAMVAKSRSRAEDAAELVEIDYEARDPVVDVEEALRSSSSLVIDEWGSNEAYSTEIHAGDAEKAFASAGFVLKESFRIQRQYGSAMEPRGVVACYDQASDSLTVYSSTQWPHIVRTILAEMLRIGEHKIRVIAPDVGGGFGNKQDIYPEEIIAAYLAKKLRRPIKWTASRSEDMLSTVHARDQVHHLEIAATRDGTLLAVKDRIVADLGAFHVMSLGPQLVSLATLPGAYKIRNWSVKLQCVVTNKTPVGAYRGFGASESNFALERAVDIVSRELKLDPSKVRLKNFIRREEFPYSTAFETTYDSGDYADCLNRGLKLVEYDKFKERQRLFLKDGRLIGLGLSFDVETTGIGSTRQMAADGFNVYGGYDSATVKIERSGEVTVLTGLSPHGQGLETTLAQVCADELGVRLEDVRVVWGDTQSAPYGFGTWGSRSAITGSSVVKMSTLKLKAKARKLAAHFLKAKEEEIEFDDGLFFLKRSRSKSISLRELAGRAYSANDLPSGMEPALEVTSFYDPPSPSYSYAVHIPVVEVDRESGQVRILSYSIVHDCGTIINPAIVDGQLHGGVAQGIAGALLEELSYNPEGQLISSNFMEYLVPTASDVPDIATEHTETPSTINPFGVKGMGEGGAIAPPAAIANAVDDALSQFGARVTETPITPERILSLIRHAKD